MKLLFAEDEVSLSEAVVDILTYHNYLVDTVYDGEEALSYARLSDYDGIILDIMMPKLNGLEVLKILRNEGINSPVLLLTAKSEVEDRIAGFDMGADDYLQKPFVMKELLSRIRAMLRRRDNYTPDVISCGDFTLNRQSYELSGKNSVIVLPKLEFRMLELFVLNSGIYLSSEEILEKTWGYDTDVEIGTVWVYISYLRKRLLAAGSTVKIKSKRNLGYMLEVEHG